MNLDPYFVISLKKLNLQVNFVLGTQKLSCSVASWSHSRVFKYCDFLKLFKITCFVPSGVGISFKVVVTTVASIFPDFFITNI